MYGYLKTSGVKDVGYKALKINHLFKDDFIYISYKDKLKYETDEEGYISISNYDIRISGNSIIPILLSIEKYSDVDTSNVRKLILEKFEWWKQKYSDDYNECFKNNEDIFEYYKNKEVTK
jgi:hypothetical protein